MRTQKILTLGITLMLLLVAKGNTTHASSQASVTIEQISSNAVGTWTLISGDGSSRSSSADGIDTKSQFMALSDFGPMTLSVLPPQGTSVKISVYRGGELVESVLTPQYSFTLYPNDTYRFLIQYSLSRTGSLGITSVPPHVRFRMKSESGKAYAGITPFTFVNIPAGRYSVQLASVEGCLQPAPQSAVLIPEERVTMHVSVNCQKAETGVPVLDTRPTKRSLVEYAKQRELKRRGERK